MNPERFKKYTMISLFSGAGGLDIGFEKSGFKTIWANDIDKDACETHKLWSNATVVCGDISKIDFQEIPNADIISGGFPCQGFSLAGPRKIDDERNALYRYFVKLVEAKNPTCFHCRKCERHFDIGGWGDNRGYLIRYRYHNNRIAVFKCREDEYYG